jgi:nucleotidyltransferase substrate binding protein (TIGR01987 family)
MVTQDIRWQQRFSNYKKALAQLTEFMELKSLNKFEAQGLIQAFEYTHELAWKTLSDFLKYQGNTTIFGSKDTTREAFNLSLIDNGETWMKMIEDRNLTSHTYNEETAKEIVTDIKHDFYPAFINLEKKLDGLL